MTPYEIGILLHYHCRADDHEDLQRDPPIFRPTIHWALDAGLLKYVNEADRNPEAPMTYAPTDRLHAYCNALKQVPLPVWKVDWSQLREEPEWAIIPRS